MSSYLNNAATTFPKPPEVVEAMTGALTAPPSNPFRSSSACGKDVLSLCRENIGQLLGIADTDRIFFAGGATDALNRIFGGLSLDSLPVVITQTEHNSVLRPLYNNAVTAPNVHVVPCNEYGYVAVQSVEAVLDKMPAAGGKPYAGLFVLNHCSNVTGAVQDVCGIAEAVHRHGFILLLDASQSAGCLPVTIDRWGVDIAAFTGHKGMFGPTGTGGYYVGRHIALRPVVYGGTGRDSSIITYNDGDYEYEAGTQNTISVAGLNAGIGYVLAEGIAEIEKRESGMMQYIYKVLSGCRDVVVYTDMCRPHGPLLSFNIKSLNPSDVGYILQNGYDVTVRTGLHCSPLIHDAMSTSPAGTVRVSVSCLTTDEDIETFLGAIKEMLSS